MSISAIQGTITNGIKKFAGRPSELTAKALGFGTMLSVIYDSHINGRDNARIQDHFDSNDRFGQNIRNKMMIYKRSQTISDAKDSWFNYQQTMNAPHVVSRSKGYALGFFETTINNLPEIALSILAMSTKKHKFLGKTAGLLLALNIVKNAAFDVMGIGNDRK